MAIGILWASAPKYEAVPAAALQNLRGTRGKAIRNGVVFVNGRYLPPPYTIWRRGTAIYIGDVQATGQIVPWSAFVMAQNGAVAPAPKKEEKKPAAASNSVDDLFDDDPAPKKTATASASAAAAEPQMTGTFVENAKTKRYLKRIMDYRTDVDRRLRRGEILFFGSRYSMLHVEGRMRMPLMNALPKALREAQSASDLQARLRSQGIVYLSNAICEELYDNQAMSYALDERRAKMQEEDDVMKTLDAGAQGVAR